MSSDEMVSPKKLLELKLKLLEDALTHKQRWYTGVPIKKYLTQKVFNLFNDQNPSNLVLESDRWSAYCHYSNLSAFQNLLDKHGIHESSRVVVHPLLPHDFIDLLVSRGVKIIDCDITLDTLVFNQNQLTDTFKHIETAPNLVIHYSDNGFYKQIEDQLEISKKYTVPTLIYANNSTITPDLIDLIQSHTLGSFLWNFGDGFLDNILDEVLEIPLASKNWTVSWYLENRITSSPEHHLAQSQSCYEPIVESYYSLILGRYRQIGLKTIMYNLKHKIARNMKKFDRRANQQTITNNYALIATSAVPDIVFELENHFATQSAPQTFYEISHLSHQIKISCKILNNLVTTTSANNKKNIDIIPVYYDEVVYLKYYFYTKDKQHWADWAYKQGLKIYEQQPLHLIFNKDLLINATKISQEIVYFDTVDILI
jgi:hypothetical protein